MSTGSTCTNPVPVVDFNVYQGDTYFHSFTWVDSEGNPKDLTGYTARLQVRNKAGGDTVLIEIDTTGGGITLGGTDGTIDIELAAADTGTLTKDAYYDLELTDPASKVETLVRGSVCVFTETTK